MQIQLKAATAKLSKRKILLLTSAVSFILVVILQDLVEAGLNNFPFYFSESLLFSSFWWIFIPFLYGQYIFVQQRNTSNTVSKMLLLIVPAVVHFFMFPALVLLLSFLFYYHTFEFQQTFHYCLSEHLYQIVLFYTLPVFTYLYFKSTIQPATSISEPEIFGAEKVYTTALMISEHNKTFPIAVADILYFTASSPYVNVFSKDKKYLCNGTLKLLSEKINNAEFVRIHKSTIVNIKKVMHYTSRLNGDYDLLMEDGTSLRVSRNYAAAFKDAFNQGHQVALK